MAWFASVWRRWFHRVLGRASDPGPAEMALEQASNFDRQALRAIVGRKRRHDLVRRHELEELRQLRRQGLLPAQLTAVGKEADAADSDLLDDPLEREKTLEKIDAIEAQMARHWWRGKLGGIHQAAPMEELASDGAEPGGNTQLRTEPPLPAEASDFAPTRAATLPPPSDDTGFVSTLIAGPSMAGMTRLTAAPVAVEAVEIELREAALLWARGQPDAAISLLQAALTGFSGEDAQARLQAALDDARQAAAGHGLRLTGPVPDLDAQAVSIDGRLVLDCADWCALDFAAAGSILNWAQVCQGEGRRVELHHARPLLAALFAALELDSLARLVPAA